VGSGANQNDKEAWMITLSDTDADGRPDYIDNCPNEPNGPANNPGGGAPQQDTDGDGLGDACDLSITTVSLPSARAGKPIPSSSRRWAVQSRTLGRSRKAT
jgi:hypothetical protein